MGYYTITITIADKDIIVTDTTLPENVICSYLEESVMDTWNGFYDLSSGPEDEDTGDCIDVRSFEIKAERTN